MNFAQIKFNDIANGLGVRVSLFVSGCRNHCKGCFNEITWDFAYGKPFTQKTESEIFEQLSKSHIAGLSILGGEPFEEENQNALAPFLQRVKTAFPQKDIWLWTGYLLDLDLAQGGRKFTQNTQKMLDSLDFIVDGPFVEEKKNLMLNFRGSENQRIWKKIKNVWKIVDL